MQQAFAEHGPEHMPLPALLSCAGSAVARYTHALAAEYGSTPTALGVLGVLARRDGLSHRELAGRLGLTPATLTPVLDRLEEAGELRRERDPEDRRVVRLLITGAGRERVADAAGVATRIGARMPQPPAHHEDIIRSYLCAVLGAVAEERGW
jgi:DNA-binding MarR family transcriptional regulator